MTDELEEGPSYTRRFPKSGLGLLPGHFAYALATTPVHLKYRWHAISST